MKGIFLIVVHLITAGGIIIGCNSAGQPSPRKSFVWHRSITPLTMAMLDRVAQNFDFFVLAYGDENERDELKAKGITSPFSQYPDDESDKKSGRRFPGLHLSKLF